MILGFSLSHCVSDAKKNLDRLKTCKITLADVEVKLVSNPSFPLFPKLEIFPIVNIQNPNEEAVNLYEFDLAVTLLLAGSSEYLGKVKNESTILVEPLSEKRIRLALQLDESKTSPAKLLQLALKTLEAADKGESTEFEVNGTVQLDSALGKIPFPVSERTKVKIKR